jgi:hypothetical protein
MGGTKIDGKLERNDQHALLANVGICSRSEPKTSKALLRAVLGGVEDWSQTRPEEQEMKYRLRRRIRDITTLCHGPDNHTTCWNLFHGFKQRKLPPSKKT